MKNLRLDSKPSFLSGLSGAQGNVADYEGIIKQDAAFGGNLVLDSAGQAFFENQLKLVKSGSWDVEYQELKADQYIPVDTEGDLGTDTIEYRSFSKIGYAKVISDFANDIPRVDLLGTKQTVSVKTVASSYGYNIFEIAKAQKAGLNLSSKRAETSTQANMERLDALAWHGSSADNLNGFLDYPGILEYIVPNGDAAATEWSSKTAAEILEDMNQMTRTVLVTTNGRKVVNQILLTIAQYDLISTKQNSDASDISVLQYFLNTHPGVSVDWVSDLAGAGDGGADMMMAYVKDIRNLAQYRPVPMMTMPTEYANMEYVVPQISRTAGVVVYYPQSVIKAVGI